MSVPTTWKPRATCESFRQFTIPRLSRAPCSWLTIRLKRSCKAGWHERHRPRARAFGCAKWPRELKSDSPAGRCCPAALPPKVLFMRLFSTAAAAVFGFFLLSGVFLPASVRGFLVSSALISCCRVILFGLATTLLATAFFAAARVKESVLHNANTVTPLLCAV